MSRMKTNGSLTRDLSSKVDACMGGPSQCQTPPSQSRNSSRHAPSSSSHASSPRHAPHTPRQASCSSPSPAPTMRPLNSAARESTPDEDYNSLARSHGVSLPKPVQSCDDIRNKVLLERESLFQFIIILFKFPDFIKLKFAYSNQDNLIIFHITTKYFVNNF